MASHVSVCVSSGIASSPECGTALCCSSPCLAALHTPFLIAGLYTWTALDKLLPYMVTKEPRSLTLCVLAVNVLIVTPLHMCHCWYPGMYIFRIFPCMVMKEPGSLPLCVYYACLHGLAWPTCHALDSTALMSPRGRNSLRGCLQLSVLYCFSFLLFHNALSCHPHLHGSAVAHHAIDGPIYMERCI